MSWQYKKQLQCKSKLAEVTGLHSNVSQFPNSDERNKMVLTDRLTLKMVLMKKVGTHAKSGRSILVLNVPNLIKKIKDTGSTEHRKGSGRPVTATTEENVPIFEELVCSQEDEPGTDYYIRQIAPRILISKSLVHHLVKKRIFIATNV